MRTVLGRSVSLIALSAVGLSLVSCNDAPRGPTSGEPKAAIAPGTATAQFNAANLKNWGPQFFGLPTCPQALEYVRQESGQPDAEFQDSEREFALTITGADPARLTDVFKKQSLGPSGVGPAAPAWEQALATGKPKPTKWDFDTELGAPIQTNGITHYRTATIKISLRPLPGQRLRFVDIPFTVRAGDINGLRMFCGATLNANVLTFTVYQFPEDGKHFGSFNLGIVVEDQNGQHEMPVFFDPEVKNDG